MLKRGKESWCCISEHCKGSIRVFEDECTHANDHDRVPDLAKSATSVASLLQLHERDATSIDVPRRMI